jgi:hypothetical protein
LADDTANVVMKLDEPHVILMAHNRAVTYGYTGNVQQDRFYCDIPAGSIVVDPWRTLPRELPGQIKVISYGNTRSDSV